MSCYIYIGDMAYTNDAAFGASVTGAMAGEHDDLIIEQFQNALGQHRDYSVEQEMFKDVGLLEGESVWL